MPEAQHAGPMAIQRLVPERRWPAVVQFVAVPLRESSPCRATHSLSRRAFFCLASEHAGKAAAIQVDGLKHFAPFADAHATLVGNVCIPHGVVHVYADSIWYAVTQVGPYPPVLQASVCGNVESRKAFAMGFGNDQRRIVRSNGYPIWEREAIGDLTD